MTDLDEPVATDDDEYRRDAEGDGTEPCKICGLPYKKGYGMRTHMRAKHGVRASSNGNGRSGRTMRVDTDTARVVPQEEEDRLVESLTTVGMFVAPLVPHTGLTIISRAGDREIPIPNAKPVHKRGIASVMVDYGKRDPRVMRAIVRFNNLMHGGDAFELAASLAAAVAVDTRIVSAHLTLPIPGVPEEAQPQPVMMLIPDVVEEVERLAAEHQARQEPEPVEAGAEA